VAFTVRAKLDGLQPILKRLEGLKRSMQKSIIRKAVDAAGKETEAAIKPLVPKDTGLLLRSMGRKVVVGRKSGVALAIVGPRTGYKVVRAQARTAKSQTAFAVNKKTGKVRKVILRLGSRSPVQSNPTQYGHLVEGGRKGVKPTSKKALAFASGVYASAGPVKATRFMARGLEAAKGRVVGVMTQVIQSELAKARSATA
jgi:hypothetical protein